MQDKSFIKLNSNIKIDGFKISNRQKNFNDLLKDYQLLTPDTVIMNNFSKKIEADYVALEALTMDKRFYLYRKTYYQPYYDYIGKIEGNSFTFTDYNVVSGEYYHYLATLENLVEETGGSPYTSYSNFDENGERVYAQAKWDNFSICDIVFNETKEQYYVNGSVWLLKCNIESGEITQRSSVTSWDTLGKYNKVSIGQKNFDSGTLSCLLGEITEYNMKINEITQKRYGYTEKININSKYGVENEKEQKWKNFISNGSLKLLKDFKGNKWIIQVMQDTTRSIDYNAVGKITFISFTWEEIEDSNKYPIVGGAGIGEDNEL